MKKNVYTDEAYRRFVTEWQGASSLEIVAKKIGVAPRKASVIASFLRRRGVKLKCFPRGRAVDYAGLKVLATKSVK